MVCWKSSPCLRRFSKSCLRWAGGFKTFAKAGSELWARYGYTTAQEGRASPDTVRTMQSVAAEGGFAIDVVTYPDVLMDRDFIKANVSQSYDHRFRIAGAKLYDRR